MYFNAKQICTNQSSISCQRDRKLVVYNVVYYVLGLAKQIRAQEIRVEMLTI